MKHAILSSNTAFRSIGIGILALLALKAAAAGESDFPAAARPGFVNVADYVPSDGSADASAAIQALIDANPNRTLWFADGTYLLENPICTPAEPTRSVDLQLSNYAVLKAAPGWTNSEAMVRLGAIHPANNIRIPGSVYSLTGGIIDGASGLVFDGDNVWVGATWVDKNTGRWVSDLKRIAPPPGFLREQSPNAGMNMKHSLSDRVRESGQRHADKRR